MANAKKITIDFSESAVTAYCIIRRESDGFLINAGDGAFAASPADPALTLTEDTVIRGRYEAAESRTVWDDGRYTVAAYKQSGASPDPAADTIIGSGELSVKDDVEVYLDAMPSFVHKWVLNRLEFTTGGGGTETVTLFDDDGVTALKTWVWDGGAKSRSAAV